MTPSTAKSKSQILAKFLGSGINLAPNALLSLQLLPISWKDIEKFIQKISFSPNFSSYLSHDQVMDEFGQIIQNIPEYDPSSPSINSKVSGMLEKQGYGNPDGTCSLDENNSSAEKSNPNFVGQILDDSSMEYIPEPPDTDDFPKIAHSQNNNPLPNKAEIMNPSSHSTNHVPSTSENFLTPSLSITSSTESQVSSDSAISAVSIPATNPISVPPIETPSVGTTTQSQSAPSSLPKTSAENVSSPVKNEDDEITRIRAEKQKSWEKLAIRSGTSTFNPIASDYDGEIEILKDPTGHLFTDGKIGEFISVMKDKYEKLRDILKRRPEGNEILDIGMINRLDSSVEVKFIGMVVEKRQTNNKNYIIKLEDPTGVCTVLVRQEPVELYSQMMHLLEDQVVIIDGYLSVKQEKNSRIVLVNNIIFPDAPNRPGFQGSQEDLGICLISDTHFGSKDWLGKVWNRFVDYLNCRIGNDNQMKQAGKIKYLCIAGDIVDGIGIYPNQDKRLTITDIYDQYSQCAEYFAEIPEYIEIILSPGDHDAVRNAVPTPAIEKDFAKALYDDPRVTMLGCPSLVSLHGVKTQLFHGTSLIDLNMTIPGMTNEDPVKTMREYIVSRHLAPSYGKKTQIAPVEQDWLVLETLPDILHTGHLHKNGCGWYHGTLLVNSGCFQGQTDFMDNLGIEPDFGKPTIVNIKDRLSPHVIDLVGDY